MRNVKRTCTGCKAFDEIANKCGLGYKVQTRCSNKYFITYCTPLEECPKPLTIQKFVELKMRNK